MIQYNLIIIIIIIIINSHNWVVLAKKYFYKRVGIENPNGIKAQCYYKHNEYESGKCVWIKKGSSCNLVYDVDMFKLIIQPILYCTTHIERKER